jgi:hypothetical protein
MKKEKRREKVLDAADILYKVVADYCMHASFMDRPTVDMCNALDKFQKQWNKMVEGK